MLADPEPDMEAPAKLAGVNGAPTLLRLNAADEPRAVDPSWLPARAAEDCCSTEAAAAKREVGGTSR